MFSITYLNRLMRSVFSIATLGVIMVPIAFAQVPAQYPLLNTSGGGVPPNVMLTMDDSGSMAFKHLPEATFAGGTFATANPVGTQTVRWDPSDNYMFTVFILGTVPGNINSTNYVQKALRSPDTNTMFYNPEIRYQPWAVSTFPLPTATASSPAGRLANSPPAAAFLDPVNPTGSTINLTAYTAPSGSDIWCYSETTYPPTAATPSPTPPVISINSLVVGVSYTIISKGTSDFRTVGSNGGNNKNGGRFVATGTGTGTGTAQADTPPTPPTPGNCSSKANNDPTLNHDPGVYFRLQKQSVSAGSFVVGTTYTIASVGTTNFTLIGASSNSVGKSFTASGTGAGSGTVTGYKAVNVHTNYDAKSINVGASFPKVAARLDCSGTVGSTGCTQAQERQNFANWYSYYRNRNLLARGAMMEAFATVGNTIRLGFGRINNPTGTVDTVSTTVIESLAAGTSGSYGGGGVRPFDQTRKTQLFNWLMDLPASGGTPLPAAMQAVGEYYSRTDAQGPYTDIPGSANSVSNNKTCRRSYHLMMTDGYWNGAPTVGDQDSTAGTTIIGAGSTQFTFPANTLPYSDGVPNTLADVAMKYWKNDIQPSMANEVRASSADPSFWQNMTNFTVGLGVQGAARSRE